MRKIDNIMDELKNWLKETEKKISAEQDKIPEVFNDIDDGQDFYYYEGILHTIEEIKNIIGA